MIFMVAFISHGDEEGVDGCALLVRHKIKPKTD